MLLAMKKRGFGSGRWNGVGGKLEPEETIEQAVVRECKEEIGVDVKNCQKVAEIIFDEAHQGKREQMQVHVFRSASWVGNPVETEEMAPKWFSKDALPYDEMWSDDPYWLPEILNGKYLRCEFTLDDNDQVIPEQNKIEVVESF